MPEKVQEYIYELQNMWNIDELGFGISESQSSKVLIPVSYKHATKMVAEKQKWIIDIECINVFSEAFLFIIYLKDKTHQFRLDTA